MPIRHDYSLGTHENGWGIIGFDFHAPGMVKVIAFGLKRNIRHENLEQIYLLPGEEVVISMPDGDVLYEIVEIRYKRDPYDLYEAKLEYIQHLTGMRIVGHQDEKQHARSLEWSQRKRRQE